MFCFSIFCVCSWKQCGILFITKMALWQVMPLGTWSTVTYCWYQWTKNCHFMYQGKYIYIYIYIYKYIYIYSIQNANIFWCHNFTAFKQIKTNVSWLKFASIIEHNNTAEEIVRVVSQLTTLESGTEASMKQKWMTAFNDTHMEGLVLYWILYKNSLKYKFGCFWHFSYVYTLK